MRLSANEVQNLLESLSQNLKEIPYRVYLFGSRVDDQKKGGDIDLLLIVSPQHFGSVYEMKSILKFDLETAAGDQRVDLTLATDQKLKQDPFLSAIADEMVLLSSM